VLVKVAGEVARLLGSDQAARVEPPLWWVDIRAAAGLPDGKVKPAAGAEGGPVTLTLTSGEKVYGTKLTEGKDWYTLETRDGGSIRIRASEVKRVDLAKGVRPAGGE
jgi:hypothetical protein